MNETGVCGFWLSLQLRNLRISPVWGTSKLYPQITQITQIKNRPETEN